MALNLLQTNSVGSSSASNAGRSNAVGLCRIIMSLLHFMTCLHGNHREYMTTDVFTTKIPYVSKQWHIRFWLQLGKRSLKFSTGTDWIRWTDKHKTVETKTLIMFFVPLGQLSCKTSKWWIMVLAILSAYRVYRVCVFQQCSMGSGACVNQISLRGHIFYPIKWANCITIRDMGPINQHGWGQ